MSPTFSHPPLGTVIDRQSLELVEILGTGGYGVVYRAVEVRSRKPRSYAVKCLPGVHESGTRWHLHMREVALHRLASAHPSIITLHRVVRENGFAFLVMDFAPDGDLFGQILQEGSYLGRDGLIRRVFVQIIDAVQHCHSLGIYHRDLKPENVLCFERGLRVAITDFGLATTDERSREFKTGSVYHMSPGKSIGSFEEATANIQYQSVKLITSRKITRRCITTSGLSVSCFSTLPLDVIHGSQRRMMTQHFVPTDAILGNSFQPSFPYRRS